MKKLYGLALLVLVLFAGFASMAISQSSAVAPTAQQPAIVDDGLNINDYLIDVPTHQDDDAGIDPVGAFRFICSFGTAMVNGKAVATAAIDPVVYPGQVGASHDHQFYGNNGVNANSTYQTLRLTGSTSCMNILNRSAYWVPALRNGLGKNIRPEFMSVYYKRIPRNSPFCTVDGVNWCIQLPRGLRYIFGYNMVSQTVTSGGLHFNVQGTGSTPGNYATLVDAAKNAVVGGLIGAIVDSPDCWDGVNLDSPDHRSHMHDAVGNGQNGRICPASHPWILPKFTLGEWFTVDDTLDRSGTYTPGMKTWRFSSDRMWMNGMWMDKVPGSTFHGDWFGAWNDQVLKIWTDNCIDRHLSCADGDLGNGKALARQSGPYGNPLPRLVAEAPMAREPFRAKIGPTR